MSLYNMLNGVNPATFFILPMLGEKHPEQYPRFRDCHIDDSGTEIHLLTRVGGNNRGCGYGEEKLQEHPNYLRDEDADFDSTYATYIFSVPDEWKEDFEKIKDNRLKEISQAYKDRLYTVYPKLKDTFDRIFDVKP